MISLFFIGFLLLAILWNLYYARNWSKNLTVSLNFLQNFVYAGDMAQMREQIENRKKLPLPVLEVAFHVDKNLSFQDCENTNVSDYTYKRDIFALLGNQRITRTLTLNCPKRGFYRISQSDLTAFSMLHRRRFSVNAAADTALYVYAARANVSDILVVCERLMGNLQCAKRLYEDPFAFSSIREYTPTDPMNTINWKASARVGGLMVNTFESTLTEKVMIYLDVEDSGILKYEYLTEESVSVAASLAQKLTGRGMEVGICANICVDIDTKTNSKMGKTADSAGNRPLQLMYLEPASGKKQLSDIEQMLARHQADGKTVPLSTVLDMSATIRKPSAGLAFANADARKISFEPPMDAVTILISKNTAQNQSAIEKFIGREKQAIWVIPYTRNEHCDVQTPDNIRLVKREVNPN